MMLNYPINFHIAVLTLNVTKHRPQQQQIKLQVMFVFGDVKTLMQFQPMHLSSIWAKHQRVIQGHVSTYRPCLVEVIQEYLKFYEPRSLKRHTMQRVIHLFVCACVPMCAHKDILL